MEELEIIPEDVPEGEARPVMPHHEPPGPAPSCRDCGAEVRRLYSNISQGPGGAEDIRPFVIHGCQSCLGVQVEWPS